MTYPNQRTIIINREKAKTDFLGIKNENWKAAARDLRPPAFMLYIYLAANADKYSLALSPAAVRQEIGMARSTYHDQFHILVDKGYLVPSHGNTYDFFEKPQPRADTQSKNELSADGLNFDDCTAIGNTLPLSEQNNSSDNTEINNRDISIDNKGINIEKIIEIKQPIAQEPERTNKPTKERKPFRF